MTKFARDLNYERLKTAGLARAFADALSALSKDESIIADSNHPTWQGMLMTAEVIADRMEDLNELIDEEIECLSARSGKIEYVVQDSASMERR